MTLDEIEEKIACREMTAAQVFTQMKQHYQLKKWTNGHAEISWLNGDEVLITSPYGQTCKLDGGDFESFLIALTSCKKIT